MRNSLAFYWNVRWSLLLTVMLLMVVPVEAQVVSNGGFSNNASCVSGNSNNPFLTNCVPGWSSAHGSPQIKGVNPNTYAYMWSEDGAGSEGIFTSATLMPSQLYQISYWARSSTTNPAQLQIEVTAGLTPNASTATPTPAQRALAGQQSLNSTWTQYIVQFTAPNWSNPQLWFHPPVVANTRYDVNLDSIKVTSCLTSDVYYQNTNMLPASTRTQGRIIAGSTVVSALSPGPVIVQNGQNVSFRALKGINITEGFSVEAGAEFEAIAPFCPNYNRETSTSNSATAQDNSQAKGSDIAASPQVIAPNPCNCLGVATNSRPTADVEPLSSTYTPLGGQRQIAQSDSVIVSEGAILMPNPTANKLEFRPSRTELGSPSYFVIYSKEGNELKSFDCQKMPQVEDRVIIDVSFLPEGLYHYRFISGMHTESGHFVVQR